MVESSDLICNLVYDFYETRIGLDLYKYGDTLPPIPKIAEAFRVAPRTVRAALARLEKNGYIRISPRRLAEVIYRADPDQIGKMRRCNLYSSIGVRRQWSVSVTASWPVF